MHVLFNPANVVVKAKPTAPSALGEEFFLGLGEV
jgi:hypothetical protein